MIIGRSVLSKWNRSLMSLEKLMLNFKSCSRKLPLYKQKFNLSSRGYNRKRIRIMNYLRNSMNNWSLIKNLLQVNWNAEGLRICSMAEKMKLMILEINLWSWKQKIINLNLRWNRSQSWNSNVITYKMSSLS